ncbi:MAG: AmmeMemoRadiSam system protein A [Oceanicoccus sp.]
MKLFSAIERQQMMSAVFESINHGLNYGTRLEPDTSKFNDSLLYPAATFVTLTMDGLLRGSMGSITATEPLADNIQYNAYSAAFEDPRFLPLNSDELPLVDVDISILRDREKIFCQSEAELLQQLQPGADGLILTEGDTAVTFLPTVWKQLVDVNTFVRELKGAAGLEPHYWSDTLIAERFSVDSYRKSH